MESKVVKFINPLTTTTTTTTFPLKFLLYPRINPHRLSPTPTRTQSLSLSATSSNGAVSPPFNFPRLNSFLSLSSNPNSQINFTNNVDNFGTRDSSGEIFRWYRSEGSAVGGIGKGGEKKEVAAVVLGWLGAEQKHLRRYAEMYTKRGIDAVTFVVPVKELLWFDLGRKVDDKVDRLAAEVVSWLSNDDDDSGGGGEGRSLVFHTFSTTGWLVYGAILSHMQERPDLIEKIKGCIVDSGGDPELDPKVWAAGFGAALLKKRNTQVSQTAEAIEPGSDRSKSKLQDNEPLISETTLLLGLEKMFTFLFKLPVVRQKLMKYISLLSENQPPCPQLYLYSTADKVIRYQTVESFIELQKAKGRIVRSFNFESSPHVDHYRTFPDKYSSLVNSFIDEILVTGKQN